MESGRERDSGVGEGIREGEGREEKNKMKRFTFKGGTICVFFEICKHTKIVQRWDDLHFFGICEHTKIVSGWDDLLVFEKRSTWTDFPLDQKHDSCVKHLQTGHYVHAL